MGGGIMSLSKEGIGGGDYRGIDMGSRTGFGILKKISRGVKKVAKGVKSIAKSDVGKAALLAAGAYYAPGIGIKAKFGPGIKGLKAAGIAARSKLGDFFIGSPLTEGVGRDTFATSGLGKILGFGGATKGTGTGSGFLTKGLALAGLTTFLTSQFGMSEEQAEEVLANPESRAVYLKRYYENLNPNAAPEEVEEFVAANVTEYMAEGGRIGFAEGPVLPPDPTQPVNPFGPKPEDFGIEEDIPIKMASNIENDKILEALFEKYLDMGLSPKEAEKAARDEFDRMSKKRMEPTIRGVAALGGRMGFDKGTPMGLQGLGSLMDEEMVVIIDYDEDGNPRLVRVPKSEVMKDMKKSLPVVVEDDMVPIVVDDKMDSRDIVIPMDKEKVLEGIVPRDNKARGDTASDNAMQAAGVEGLPIRQNPKGVKELDLRKTGGFIPPVGIKEKADDIPAMLSNNEFVFTADAVRGAGGGNVELGAQRMYDTMKRLEAGGKA